MFRLGQQNQPLGRVIRDVLHMRRRAASCAAPIGRTASGNRAKNRARRGTAALEFALVSPLLLTLIGGIFDFGRAEYTRIQVSAAIAAASEYASLRGAAVQPFALSTIIQNATSFAIPHLSISAAAGGYACETNTGGPITSSVGGSSQLSSEKLTNVNWSNFCGAGASLSPGSYVTITVSYTLPALLSSFLPNDLLKLQQTVVVRTL